MLTFFTVNSADYFLTVNSYAYFSTA